MRLDLGPDRFKVGDRVVFTGYAPKPPIPGVITTVLRRPSDHPAANEVTGYILEVDGGHGATLCAEPDQLHADPRAVWDGS